MTTFAGVAALFGFLYAQTITCQDCQKKDEIVNVIANITGNATFHIHSNETDDFIDIYLYRGSGEMRKTVALIHGFGSKLYIYENDPIYERRFSANITIESTRKRDIFVTLSAVEVADAGIYIAEPMRHERFQTCFTLYVLGEPTSSLRQFPAVVEEGNAGHLQCISRSTTVPTTHNLTMDISWYIGGQRIETAGRFRVAYDELDIYFMSRADKNLVVLCEAHEHFGFSSWANITMQINWGPSPGPDLWPATTLYYLEFGDRVPTINCTADCHPDCEITWKKVGSLLADVSWNGLLSLGTVMDNTTGEYLCTASRNGTYERNSKAVTLIMNENKVSEKASDERTTATTAVVGGALGAALLLSLLVIVVLLRQQKFHCVRFSASSGHNVKIETATANRAYEDLHPNRGGQESYDSVNLDELTAGSRRDTGGHIYENNSP